MNQGRTPLDGIPESPPESMNPEEKAMHEIYIAEIAPLVEKINGWCEKYRKSYLFVCEYATGLSGMACSTTHGISSSLLLLQILAGTGGDIDMFIARARSMFEQAGIDPRQVNVFNVLDQHAAMMMREMANKKAGATTH
jgi:hypothetical protein